jgi:hypothetical protein
MYENLTLTEVQFTQPLAWNEIAPSESSRGPDPFLTCTAYTVCYQSVSFEIQVRLAESGSAAYLIFKIPAHRGTETAT